MVLESLPAGIQVGSFFFIGEIILDVDLDYDQPVSDHCGSCTKCLDACPTEAIIQPNVVDGSKCISYLTIELKDEIIAINGILSQKIGINTY